MPKLTRTDSVCNTFLMKSFVEIIDLFPSKRYLADLLDTNPMHIRTMRSRDWIPPRYWHVLIEYAETVDEESWAGLNYETLGRLAGRAKAA